MVDYFNSRILLQPSEVPKEWINLLQDLPSPSLPVQIPQRQLTISYDTID